MTFSARYIANIIHFASQQGASRRELLAIVGMEMQELNDENLRLEAEIYNRLLERALELTGDPYFGLHMGEYLSLSAAGLITQIVQSSRTVQEGLEYLVAFANLGCQALPFTLEEREQDWELSVIPSTLWLEQSPLAVRHTMDAIFYFSLREYQTLSHQKKYPLAIHFNYDRPKYFQEYERLFEIPVRFGQTKTALYLDKKQVAAPVVTSDFALLQVLVRHAEEKLALMDQNAGFHTIVKQSIINMVKPQFPTIEQVAANLNISVRTLQRRLKEEGFAYKAVLDELKRQFALDYLQNPKLSIKEIAYLLDYADSSAFTRSFKRWMGESPLAYRRSVA
ncbi:MAG: transcriptional regulator [Saprospiraceae bacterium]|nr:MAG: transcriptional regulator [Saprospiraceae bacterium]